MGTVKVRDFKFASSNNYYDIHGMMWIPEGDIRAVVQISHGMAEHISRYDEFAGFLAERGILAVGNDHMGHGLSINSDDDLGYFSIPVKGVRGRKKEKYSSSALAVKDLYHVTKIVKKHYPGVPYIVMGHSMGSFLVRRYLMEYGKEADGAIIMGTGNQSKAEVIAAMTLCDIIGIIKGERYRSKSLDTIIFGMYNRRIKNEKEKNAWITSDKEMLKKYNEDEKNGFLFTINGLKALLSTVWYIKQDKNIKKIPMDVKMLILSGREDPVGSYGKRVEEVYNRYAEQGIKDISIKLYDDCRHELLNEKIREKVYEDIYEWIMETVIRQKQY